MIGLGRGTGVTHLCIMMANYMTGALGWNIAVLEWNQQETYERMRAVCAEGSKGKVYQVLEVDYYPSAGVQELAECMKLDYQRVIIDFGSMREESKGEFFRCHRKLILASFSEWQIEAFWRFYREESKAEKKSWTYLAAFGSEETRLQIKRRLKLSVERIPLSVDAFTVTRETMAWFARLLDQ